MRKVSLRKVSYGNDISNYQFNLGWDYEALSITCHSVKLLHRELLYVSQLLYNKMLSIKEEYMK